MKTAGVLRRLRFLFPFIGSFYFFVQTMQKSQDFYLHLQEC